MSAYARSAVLLMTPSTFRQRKSGDKKSTAPNERSDVMDSVKSHGNAALNSAVGSSFRWNSKTKLSRQIHIHKEPPSSCIAFQDENSQLHATMQHHSLSQLTMSQLSDAGRSFSQRSGSHIAGVDTNTCTNRFTAVGSRDKFLRSANRDRREYGGLRYNHPSATSSTAQTATSTRSHTEHENFIDVHDGKMFFSQCSQQSDGNTTAKRSSSSIPKTLGNNEGDSRGTTFAGTKGHSKPYNHLQSRSDATWRRTSYKIAGSECSPKNTQGSSHTYPPSQTSCISLLEQDSQQDFTEKFKSQPLLPSKGDVLDSRLGTDQTRQGHANERVHISSTKKRSWMEACMDVITTPYRRNKNIKRKGGGVIDHRAADTHIAKKRMDSNGKNANSKNCPQSIMPCNQNSNAATSLASHVLEVFQTPARSKSSNHRDEKNTPVPARGDANREKVTPSPGHDTSKKVPNHQTLSKEKEELNALLGEVSEQTNSHISLKDKMEEMIASSKDNLLQEIQYAKESLEDVISRAKTLGQCLNDKLDLLKTTESNIIQSLERKGEEERESICTRGGEIMEEIIRKGDDKLKNHLEYLHEEKVSMLESIKTAVEEMGSKVQKTISDETKKEFEEVKKFMDEIMMKGKDLCDSSRRCMEVDSSTSKPREDDLPTKKSSRLKLNRKDNDKRFESSPKVMITDDTEKPEIAFVEDRPRNGTAKIRRTRKKSTKDNILQRNDTKAPIKSVEVHSVPNDLELSPLSNKSQMNTYGYSDSNGGTQLEARDDKIHEGNQVVPSSGTTDPCNIVPAQNSNSASVKSKTGINDGVQSRSEPALTVNHERTDSVPTSKTQDTLHGIPLRPRTARCSRFKDIPKPTETPSNAYSGSHFNNS